MTVRRGPSAAASHGPGYGVTVLIGQTAVTVPPGTSLPRLCAQHDTPIVFGCRAGRCGACLVEVVGDQDALGPVRPREARVLSLLGLSGTHRLGCQTVVHDCVTLRPAGPYPPGDDR